MMCKDIKIKQSLPGCHQCFYYKNFELFGSIAHSKVTHNVFFYVSGNVIRNLVRNIDYQDGAKSMVQPTASIEHQASTRASYVWNKVAVTENSFRLNVINTNEKCTNTRHLTEKMAIDNLSFSSLIVYFPSTDNCLQVCVGFFHNQPTQIIKLLCHKCLMVLLHIYAKLYKREVKRVFYK